jgi:hypothetical protein
MAHGRIIYPSGGSPQITYDFPVNFQYGHKAGVRINLNDDQRTFDGTLCRYSGPIKKKYDLAFTVASKAQKDYFLMLWDFQCPIDLYLDGSNLDATVLMMKPPEPQSVAAFDDAGQETYTFTVTFEEV